MTPKSIIMKQIADIIISNKRGVCTVCKEECKEDSEKVVNKMFDIHWTCWGLDQGRNRLVRLLHDLTYYD